MPTRRGELERPMGAHGSPCVSYGSPWEPMCALWEPMYKDKTHKEALKIINKCMIWAHMRDMEARIAGFCAEFDPGCDGRGPGPPKPLKK